MALIDGGPQVRLRNWFDRPYDDAIAAARTCYSDRVIEAHEQIVVALERRDGDQAERLIREHLGLRIAGLRDLTKDREIRNLMEEIGI